MSQIKVTIENIHLQLRNISVLFDLDPIFVEPFINHNATLSIIIFELKIHTF